MQVSFAHVQQGGIHSTVDSQHLAVAAHMPALSLTYRAALTAARGAVAPGAREACGATHVAIIPLADTSIRVCTEKQIGTHVASDSADN